MFSRLTNPTQIISSIRKQILIGPTNNEIMLDFDGDGSADFMELSNSSTSVEATLPSQGTFLRVTMRKRTSFGLIESVYFYSESKKAYVSVSERAEPFKVLNSVSSIGSDTARCGLREESVDALSARWKEILQNVGASASDREVEKFLTTLRGGKLFDDSCRQGPFKQNELFMFNGVAEVLLRSSRHNSLAPIRCLERNGLAIQAAKMEADLFEVYSGKRKHPLIRCESQERVAEGADAAWDPKADRIKFLVATGSQQNGMNPYTRLYLHEGLHKAGLDDHVTVKLAEECCIAGLTASCGKLRGASEMQVSSESIDGILKASIDGFKEFANKLPAVVDPVKPQDILGPFYESIREGASGILASIEVCTKKNGGMRRICFDTPMTKIRTNFLNACRSAGSKSETCNALAAELRRLITPQEKACNALAHSFREGEVSLKIASLFVLEASATADVQCGHNLLSALRQISDANKISLSLARNEVSSPDSRTVNVSNFSPASNGKIVNPKLQYRRPSSASNATSNRIDNAQPPTRAGFTTPPTAMKPIPVGNEAAARADIAAREDRATILIDRANAALGWGAGKILPAAYAAEAADQRAQRKAEIAERRPASASGRSGSGRYSPPRDLRNVGTGQANLRDFKPAAVIDDPFLPPTAKTEIAREVAGSDIGTSGSGRGSSLSSGASSGGSSGGGLGSRGSRGANEGVTFTSSTGGGGGGGSAEGGGDGGVTFNSSSGGGGGGGRARGGSGGRGARTAGAGENETPPELKSQEKFIDFLSKPYSHIQSQLKQPDYRRALIDYRFQIRERSGRIIDGVRTSPSCQFIYTSQSDSLELVKGSCR